MRPLPRYHVQPLRNTSPPVNQEMKINSSGAGMPKGSPYISSAGISKYSPIPCAIGCAGITFQRRSLSLASRHFSEQVVPINALKSFA